MSKINAMTEDLQKKEAEEIKSLLKNEPKRYCYIDWESVWSDFDEWFWRNTHEEDPGWENQQSKIEDLVSDYMIVKQEY